MKRIIAIILCICLCGFRTVNFDSSTEALDTLYCKPYEKKLEKVVDANCTVSIKSKKKKGNTIYFDASITSDVEFASYEELFQILSKYYTVYSEYGGLYSRDARIHNKKVHLVRRQDLYNEQIQIGNHTYWLVGNTVYEDETIVYQLEIRVDPFDSGYEDVMGHGWYDEDRYKTDSEYQYGVDQAFYDRDIVHLYNRDKKHR